MWWRHGTIYQIYVRSFRDSDGDGIGDLRGIAERLDHLSDTLGVDALWLTPFYPSPMRDFGYDISDHTNVHELFGDLDDFERLVYETHRRGMKIIIDFVPNHTSDRHAWFEESRSARSSPKRDWYVWADPKPDGSPPNNWVSVFGGPAWTLDQKTGQYYLHSFHTSMPDVNWRNAELKEAQFDVVRCWMERGADGIRIDAAQYPMKDPGLRDNPPNDGATKMHRALGEYDTLKHEHDMAHPDIHDMYKELRSVLDEYPDRAAIGEIHVFDWPKWAAYYGGGTDELHMVFNFGLLGVEWTAEALRGLIVEIEGVLPADGGWPNWAVGNHDEPRVATREGPELARIAALLQMTLRGTPTLYYGDELGLPDAVIPPDRVVDPWGQQDPALSRDPARSPMPWEASSHAGFCPEEVEPWLPLVEDHERLSVAAELDDPNSFLSFTRRLIDVRKRSRALTEGVYGGIDAVDGCLVFDRIHGTDRRTVVLNLTGRERSVALAGPGELDISTHGGRGEGTVSETLTLRPYEGCLVRAIT